MPAGFCTVLLIVCLRRIVHWREIFHTSQLLLSEIKMPDLQISQSEASVYDGPLMRSSIAGQGVSLQNETSVYMLDCVWIVMAHAQKPHFVFRRNERVHLNRRGRQFSRLLAAEVCASAVVMLDTPCSEVVWRVLVTHSIRHFPLHFPSRASPCAVIFHLESTAIHGNTNPNTGKSVTYRKPPII